jgi:hypothetical protein
MQPWPAAQIAEAPESSGVRTQFLKRMLAWARSMTWNGLHPIVTLNDTLYEKGISLGKKAIKDIEDRLHCNPGLPKWDILIRPVNG